MPQAIGRTARALAASLPASVETFTIVPVDHGIPLSEVVLRRSDLEELDHAGGQDALIRARTLILLAESGLPEGTVLSQGLYPAFSWNVAPYVNAACSIHKILCAPILGYAFQENMTLRRDWFFPGP